MSSEQNQGMGPLIGSIIIVIILLVGGHYSWTSTSIPSPVNQSQTLDNSTSQPVPVISEPAKPAQASTEITDIEADAKTVDMASIDTGLENLDLLVK